VTLSRGCELIGLLSAYCIWLRLCTNWNLGLLQAEHQKTLPSVDSTYMFSPQRLAQRYETLLELSRTKLFSSGWDSSICSRAIMQQIVWCVHYRRFHNNEKAEMSVRKWLRMQRAICTTKC